MTIANEWESKLQFGKDSYSSHETDSMYLWLQAQIQEAKAQNDDNAVRNFTDQLETLQSLLKRKVMETVLKNKV
jgi:flagellin-specific chaperone FliS